MGAIIPESKENEIIKLLRKDEARKLQQYIQINEIPRESLLTNHKRTILQLSCYFESPRCLSKLIEMNHDYNQIENYTGDTPLFICSKFNNLEMVKILLAKEDCKKLVKNNENLNEFDIAFLKGNYNICYYFMYIYDNKENDNNIDNYDDKDNIINEKLESNIIQTSSKNKKDKKLEKEKKKDDYDINQIYQKYFYNTDFEYDYFLTLQAENKYPLFNMPLFFRCLCNKTPPSKCPSFAAERKKTLDLTTKIPDPNESWGHFFKRVATMELYNPPLVDKKNVSVMNSMYMNAQMKLMENEYGIKMGFYKKDNRNDDDEVENDETKHPLDVDDNEVLQIKKKVKPKKLNIRLNMKPEENNQKKEDEKIEIEDVKENEIKENEIKEKENNFENSVNEDNNEDNLCILKINENSSERDIENENKDA
jgi:hypothetical protein